MNFKKFFLVLPVLACCYPTFAQELPPSSGSYFRDLGRVIAEVRGVQWLVEICAAEYPGSKSANQTEAIIWHTKYKPFLSEMDRHFQGLPKYWATLDPQSAREAPQLWKKINAQIDTGKAALQQELQSQLTTPQRQLFCQNFPMALQSDRWNLEKYHVNAVAAIRKGPR